MATSSAKPPMPAMAIPASNPATHSRAGNEPSAEPQGSSIVVKGFTSPFRRIPQTERMDDAFACIAMLTHKPLNEVAEAAYRLGYARHGPAFTTEVMIAKLLMALGQLVASKYLDFHSWEALPDVAIVYVDYTEDKEIGRHVLWHHVRASGKQNALSYVIDPANWIKPEQGVVTDFTHFEPGWYIEVRPSGKR